MRSHPFSPHLSFKGCDHTRVHSPIQSNPNLDPTTPETRLIVLVPAHLISSHLTSAQHSTTQPSTNMSCRMSEPARTLRTANAASIPSLPQADTDADADLSCIHPASLLTPPCVLTYVSILPTQHHRVTSPHLPSDPIKCGNTTLVFHQSITRSMLCNPTNRSTPPPYHRPRALHIDRWIDRLRARWLYSLLHDTWLAYRRKYVQEHVVFVFVCV